MRKKSIISKLISCTIAVTTLLMAAPINTVKAATTWNNTADVSWIDSSKKVIAFAFDDGPVRGNTATTILNTLEKYKMHATFFYQGNQITAANKAEIKRAFDIGCEVANHTYSHPYLTNLSVSQIQNEINKNANMLKEITGQSNYLIRPPYLATNATVLNAVNVPFVTCSVDTQDWNGKTKDQIIQTVLNANDGDILLMHETYNTTAQAVEYLVPELIKRGFVITSVSELFKIKGKAMTSGQVYTSCKGANISNSTPNTKPTEPTDPTPSVTVPGETAKLADGWYYIKNVNAGKYLQVAGNTGKAVQNVELSTGTGVAGQKWYLKNVGNGYVTLKSALGDFMVDIANAKNEDGANAQIYDSYSGTAQQFMLKTTSSNNTYVIATKCSNLTKVLDDYNFDKNDGANVCQWTYGGKANQQWVFEAVNSKPEEKTSEPIQPDQPTEPTTPSVSGLKLDYNINNWGSAYQVGFKVINNSNTSVSTWTLKLKKSEIKIDTSWNVTINESGDYYVITPVSWNSNIPKGGSVEFGVQGSGSIGTTLNYTLE